jgi:hypothetical protein
MVDREDEDEVYCDALATRTEEACRSLTYLSNLYCHNLDSQSNLLRMQCSFESVSFLDSAAQLGSKLKLDQTSSEQQQDDQGPRV